MVRLLQLIYVISLSIPTFCQPNVGVRAPPPPPPGKGFQLKCSDEYAMLDQLDPTLIQEFTNNAPPGYIVEYVEPCIYPGKQAHRYVVKCRSQGPRRCEEINQVQQAMNNYKPQNSNVGLIAVVPGGFIVTYMKFCGCYRRSYRRRRETSVYSGRPKYNLVPPEMGTGGTIRKCDDSDLTCG